MTLAEFIKKNEESIVHEWEEFARDIQPAEGRLDPATLRDGIRSLLSFIAQQIDLPPKTLDMRVKSPEHSERVRVSCDAARDHADLRFLEGFDTTQIASEFLGLRTTVIKLWNEAGSISDAPLKDVTQFHEAVDQLLLESLTCHTASLNRARTLFLGTLIHDMRNPLGAISNAAQLLPDIGPLNETQVKLAGQIRTSAANLNRLVSDLIDATRVRLGKKVPIHPAPMDMCEAMHQAAKEARTFHPDYGIAIDATGNLSGEWDEKRIGQVLSNLIGNAMQHGKKGAEIKIEAKGNGEDIYLSVHNDGDPIPPNLLPTLFNPLTRGENDKQKSQPSSLGLGLFIAKEIVTAHGGDISVTSTENDGTTFIARLPRIPPVVENGHTAMPPD
jgi:signal transduction histidine kinase